MKKYLFILIVLIALFIYFLRKKMISGVKGLTPELEGFIIYKANQWGLEPALVKAIARVESNFNPSARNPADPSYGLMQITPGLAFDYGLISDWKDPSPSEISQIYNLNNNLDVACWYLAHLMSIRNFDVAIQMYNVGQAGYRNGMRNYDYLNKVRSHYETYRSV